MSLLNMLRFPKPYDFDRFRRLDQTISLFDFLFEKVPHVDVEAYPTSMAYPWFCTVPSQSSSLQHPAWSMKGMILPYII